MSDIFHNTRIIRFAIVGGIGTVLGLALFWLFNEVFMLFYMISAVITIEITILSNFALNNLWTFSDRKGGNVWKKLTKYHSITIAGMVLNLILLFIFVQFIFLDKYASYVIAVLVVFLWNYSFSNKWAWKSQ